MAQSIIPIAKGPEYKDTLISDFLPGERDYIIFKLYPIIKKTLVHFVCEANISNEINKRADEPVAESKVE